MYVDDRGSGTPVLLLHPFPFDGRIFDEIAPRIAEKARCLTVDLPGSGRSRGLAPSSLTDHAAALVQLLDDLQTGPAVICGLSFGGYLALTLARVSPRCLAGLVLAGTRATADTPKILEQRAAAADLTRTAGVHALVAKQLPSWLSDDPPEAARDAATRVALRQTPQAVLAGLEAMAGRPDATPVLAGVKVPAHIVSGAADKLIKPDEMRALLAIPGSVFHEVRGAGHLLHLTHPDALVDAIFATVAAVSRAPLAQGRDT